ncbi:MAG TPA: S9 family peptidase [Vicinamibacterales bacterium]|nr:S9 family peptidase [Vicinamibacterales bacterium]
MKHLIIATSMAVAVGAALVAQEQRSTTLLTTEHYLDWERVSDAQISPDGARVLYTREHVNKIEDRWEQEIWIVNGDGGQNRFFVKGSSPRWSPDGKRLAYLAEGEPKGPQLFVRWVDVEGPATQVTHVIDAPRGLRWSPDGKSIAFSMFVPDQEHWNISMPAEPKGAKWTPPPRVVSALHYRQDRVGFLEDGFTHLFVVPADGGTPRAVTSGKWSVGAGELRAPVVFDWTPDGRTIVFSANRAADAQLQYEVSQLLAVDVATGTIRDLVTRRGAWERPAVSPDGKLVAFIGHDITGRSHTVDDLYVVGIDGAGVRKISGDYDRDPINLRWAPDGGGVYFDADDQGTRNVQFAALAGAAGNTVNTVTGVNPAKAVRAVTTGTHVLTLDSVAAASRDLVAAGISADPEHPQDVVRYSLKQPSQMAVLTDVNGDVLQGKRIAKTEEIWYTSSGNARVQGWIVKPPSFDASKKYPLILEIHGGPFSMYSVAFNYMFQNFAANNFVVLFTNPRGSTGYGSAFANGIDHNYPGPDYDDLMAGVDAVAGKGYVDTSRMYVSGCSGGGVLSSWVIGHTDRFAAAAVRCPVIDWVSMAGHTDVPLFTYSFFAKPFWEDPSDWLSHSSLMSVGKVTTPTLLMTGVLDRRTPMPQTEEYYAALKVKGVPTKLLQFNDEYHGTSSKPSNFIRTQLYMMSWFRQYTREAGGKVTNTAQP